MVVVVVVVVVVVAVVVVVVVPPQPLPSSTPVSSSSHSQHPCHLGTVRSPVASSTAQYRSKKTQAVHAWCPQLHDHLGRGSSSQPKQSFDYPPHISCLHLKMLESTAKLGLICIWRRAKRVIFDRH